MFVLLVAGVKAVYEDFKRHAEDKETNNSVTHVMQPDGEVHSQQAAGCCCCGWCIGTAPAIVGAFTCRNLWGAQIRNNCVCSQDRGLEHAMQGYLRCCLANNRHCTLLLRTQNLRTRPCRRRMGFLAQLAL